MEEATTLRTDHMLLLSSQVSLPRHDLDISSYEAPRPEVLSLVLEELAYMRLIRLLVSYFLRKAFVLLMMLSMNQHARAGSVESYDHYVVLP